MNINGCIDYAVAGFESAYQVCMDSDYREEIWTAISEDKLEFTFRTAIKVLAAAAFAGFITSPLYALYSITWLPVGAFALAAIAAVGAEVKPDSSTMDAIRRNHGGMPAAPAAAPSVPRSDWGPGHSLV